MPSGPAQLYSVPMPPKGKHSGPGDGGGNDVLDELKKQVSKLETDMAVLKATIATKEDLHKEINGATSKFVGWMFLIFGAFTAVVTAIKYLWS